jgi:hypothetical protein
MSMGWSFAADHGGLAVIQADILRRAFLLNFPVCSIAGCGKNAQKRWSLLWLVRTRQRFNYQRTGTPSSRKRCALLARQQIIQARS